MFKKKKKKKKNMQTTLYMYRSLKMRPAPTEQMVNKWRATNARNRETRSAEKHHPKQ